jgi:MPBQ/MSBQ methyltransferase
MSADDVQRHYAGGRFRERVREGVHELHVRTTEATHELATLADVQPGDTVLDVGSGLGGPARVLASRYGADVVGLDLTPEYVEVAEELTREAGLDDRVRFVVGDATALPFDPASFDLVWTQHAAMNVAEKPRLYAELHRVLRPGGRLALYDVLAGESDPAYPLPWASSTGLSFLVAEDSLDALLVSAGFQVSARRDVTAAGREWAEALGPDAGPAFANLAAALADGRLRLLQLVATAS